MLNYSAVHTTWFDTAAGTYVGPCILACCQAALRDHRTSMHAAAAYVETPTAVVCRAYECTSPVFAAGCCVPCTSTFARAECRSANCCALCAKHVSACQWIWGGAKAAHLVRGALFVCGGAATSAIVMAPPSQQCLLSVLHVSPEDSLQRLQLGTA
jgi:hypothetical protein